MKIWGSAVFASALVIACSSSEGGSSGSSGASSGVPAIPDVPDREIAKKEIGPEGGTLTGEAVTIEVPPGAVTEKKMFAINAVAETRVGLPLRVKANKPGAYALLPDDVEFAKPVTIRITLDKAKLEEVGPGGIAAFRSEPVTNDWKKKDSKVDEAKQLVVQTTHFSWWTDGSDSDSSCITNRKGCNSESDPRDPSLPLRVDCRIPFEGAGVHCKGTGPNNTGPYECRCSDTATVLKTFQRVPDDKYIEETAKTCGATCPPIIPPGACIDPKCEGGKPGEAWSCKTERLGIAISCSFQPGKSATCACKDGVSFPIAGGPSGVPSAADLQAIMSAKCAVVDCSPPGTGGDPPPPPPPEGWVCTSPIPATPAGKGCQELSMYTCRDGHYYDTRCPANQPGPQECECVVDDVATKKVTGSCDPIVTWKACGFPRLYGE